jgi:putative membrane protein
MAGLGRRPEVAMFGGYGAGLGVAGWVLMIGLWGGLLAVVVWAVARLFPAAARGGDNQDSLDRQLAAGHIDPDAYRQMREGPIGRSSE